MTDGHGGKDSIAPPGVWPEPDDPRFKQLLRVWAGWREGLNPPKRSHIDPAALKDCLPHLWIFRLDEAGEDLTCTLAGEAIREAWGFSIQGMSPTRLWGEVDGNIARQRLLRAAIVPGIIHGRTGITPGGELKRIAERLMLPLVDDNGRPYGTMGMTFFAYPRREEGAPPIPPMLHSTLYPCAALPAAYTE